MSLINYYYHKQSDAAGTVCATIQVATNEIAAAYKADLAMTCCEFHCHCES
jgi:hypothetical protein